MAPVEQQPGRGHAHKASPDHNHRLGVVAIGAGEGKRVRGDGQGSALGGRRDHLGVGAEAAGHLDVGLAQAIAVLEAGGLIEVG